MTPAIDFCFNIIGLYNKFNNQYAVNDINTQYQEMEMIFNQCVVPNLNADYIN